MPSHQTTARRLRTLAAFLRELPRRKWDFEHFANDPTREFMSTKPVKLDPHHCKSVACAAGWATTIPSFRRAGLRLTPTGMPCYIGLEGVDAMAEFLGIDYFSAQEIFADPHYYAKSDYHQVTKTMVARALEGLAKWYD